MLRHLSYPCQTAIRAAPVSRVAAAASVCVSESPEVTSVGLSYIGNISRLHYLSLSGLRTGLINDSLKTDLRKHSTLGDLRLGHKNSPPETSFTAPAVIRSVGERLAIHTHIDSFIRPDV